MIIAVLAYFSVWSEGVNLILVLINLFFFSFSILSYVLHGWLKDTSNQFKVPHQMGRWQLPRWMLTSAMILLVIGELGATAGLLLGIIFGLRYFNFACYTCINDYFSVFKMGESSPILYSVEFVCFC